MEELTVMLSEVQKRKIHHLFNVLDIDRNGFLQPDDFVNVGKKIIDQLKLKDERKIKLILLKSHRLFVQLLTDLNNPELRLTLWDWIDFFRAQIESEIAGPLNYYIQRTSRHIFDLFDKDGDRKISWEEYSNMLTIYNIAHDNAEEGFRQLDTDKDNYISSEEMIDGLKNFFLSDNPEAQGNLIFGRWS
jgi:Ca2+-binding EF-hand superfamily protein